jgi:hypothetical protein
MMSPAILPTCNPEWGFWGTNSRVERKPPAEVVEAWAHAFAGIAAATSAAPEIVRDFLDSRDGRHFADDVANELARGAALKDATAATVARWMDWRIGGQTSRETGIPVGLPYLTGLVTHYEFLADMGRESA